MGSPSSNQQSSQQSISQVQLPPWVNQAAQQNYALAQDISNRPLSQWQGQQVADVGPQMQQAWDLAAGSGAAGADQYNAAQAGYLTAAGYQPNQVQAGQIANTNLQPYMSPFTQNVIDASLPLIQQQTQQSLMGIGDQATTKRAFGGSRQGVAEGVASAQGGLNAAQMAAQLNAQNFQQAQAAATGDIQRTFAADQGNQTANQNAINSMIQASTGLGNLGTQAQQNQRQQFLELSTAGAQQQQQAQAQIDAEKAKFNEARAYPGQQLSVLQSALGMTPYGSTTMGSQAGEQQTTTNNGIAGDIFGGLQALGGMMGSGGPLGAGGALSFLTQSDRHLKTDIKKVGVHKPTGLPIYGYRYKGDPKSYPKITGPMAEDVMQIAPHAVKTMGVHQPTGQALHGVDMAALDAVPAIRPQRMPANDNAMGRIPGALSPVAPAGLTGAMGASMRAPRIRPTTRMPRVAGGLSG